MPQLFRAADAASLEGQRSYVGGVRQRLILLVIAAATGIVSWRVGKGQIDVLGFIGVAAFILAMIVEGKLWRSRPDKKWYDGRAVAESAKTLAWKFAVGGRPFPTTVPIADATRALVETFEGLKRQFGDLELTAVPAPAVSDWMSAQRSESLDDRKRIYLDARIRDQQEWYTDKAKYNKKRSKQWRVGLVIFEFGGAVASLISAVTHSQVILAPALAMVSGAAVAWIETKQHDSLARAYSAAVADLSNAEAKLLTVESEDSWSNEVDDAEEAISREHVVWLATRHRA